MSTKSIFLNKIKKDFLKSRFQIEKTFNTFTIKYQSMSFIND